MKFARLDCLKFGNVCQKVIQYAQNMITYHPLRTIYIRIIIDAQLYDRAKIHCVTNFALSLKRTTTHMNFKSIVNCPWDQYREEFS